MKIIINKNFTLLFSSFLFSICSIIAYDKFNEIKNKDLIHKLKNEIILEQKIKNEAIKLNEIEKKHEVSIENPIIKKIDYKINAQGVINAWQESVISAEISGFKIKDIFVDVGSKVKKGDILALLEGDTINVDYLQANASYLEANVKYQQDLDNANRAKALEKTSSLSSQQFSQYISAEQISKARLESAKANLELQKLRLNKTKILSPDEGIISARKASVGSLVSQNEMFRLIRKEKFQLKVEVPLEDIDDIKKGQLVEIKTKNSDFIKAKVDDISPIINEKTKHGLIFINLTKEIHKDLVKIGMTVDTEIFIGKKNVVLISKDIIFKDKNDYYVFYLDNNKIKKMNITIGLYFDNYVEIKSEIDKDIKLISSNLKDINVGENATIKQLEIVKDANKTKLKH